MTDNLNLALWHEVERTDPNHVKVITGKVYKGSSPKPHYLVHKATETFGPAGIGWGFTVLDERIEDGAGGSRMSIARVRVWYKWNGERGEVEHVGGTVFSGLRADGKAFNDEDAPKKSVTDALVKALSMIGFAGDIFMGRYDDSKYVDELRDEFKEPPRKPEIPPYVVASQVLQDDIGRTESDSEMDDVVKAASFKTVLDGLPAKERARVADMAKRQRARFSKLTDTTAAG